MRGPSLRIVLPAAVVVTIVFPALRQAPGGPWLPDPWLALALWGVPLPAPPRLRTATLWVLILAFLRGTVSVVPPLTTLTGLGLGLVARELLDRRFDTGRWPIRVLVGLAAAAPLALLDLRVAALTGLPLAPESAAVRAAGAALLWALWPLTPRSLAVRPTTP